MSRSSLNFGERQPPSQTPNLPLRDRGDGASVLWGTETGPCPHSTMVAEEGEESPLQDLPHKIHRHKMCHPSLPHPTNNNSLVPLFPRTGPM